MITGLRFRVPQDLLITNAEKLAVLLFLLDALATQVSHVAPHRLHLGGEGLELLDEVTAVVT